MAVRVEAASAALRSGTTRWVSPSRCALRSSASHASAPRSARQLSIEAASPSAPPSAAACAVSHSVRAMGLGSSGLRASAVRKAWTASAPRLARS